MVEAGVVQPAIAAISGFMPTIFQDTREILGKHAERHLGGHLRKRLDEGMRCTHARLYRAKENAVPACLRTFPDRGGSGASHVRNV